MIPSSSLNGGLYNRSSSLSLLAQQQDLLERSVSGMPPPSLPMPSAFGRRNSIATSTPRTVTATSTPRAVTVKVKSKAKATVTTTASEQQEQDTSTAASTIASILDEIDDGLYNHFTKNLNHQNDMNDINNPMSMATATINSMSNSNMISPGEGGGSSFLNDLRMNMGCGNVNVNDIVNADDDWLKGITYEGADIVLEPEKFAQTLPSHLSHGTGGSGSATQPSNVSSAAVALTAAVATAQ